MRNWYHSDQVFGAPQTYTDERKGVEDGEELDPMEWVKGLFGGKKKDG